MHECNQKLILYMSQNLKPGPSVQMTQFLVDQVSANSKAGVIICSCSSKECMRLFLCLSLDDLYGETWMESESDEKVKY